MKRPLKRVIAGPTKMRKKSDLFSFVSAGMDDGRAEKADSIPLRRPIFPRNHTREYLMHKFWSRKPHNIVASYIANFSSPGEIVLDPFGGSGVTLIEAGRLGRRAISNDASELATFVARNTARPGD